ncbi:hypothetical protein VPH35_118202 [Triticum aestivum]
MRHRPDGPSGRLLPASPPVAVSPEMRDKCFKCLEKGHYKKECTNQIVCFRCGLPGHGSKDCKRPQSPSSVDDLRREAVAKVARRTTPPPRPVLAATSHVESRVEEAPAELCVVRRSAVVSDLERHLQFAMLAYVAGQRRVLAPARVKEILAGKLDIAPKLVSVHCYRPEDFLVVFAYAEVRNRVAACPSVEFEGDRLIFRPWNRQSQAVHSVFGFKVDAVAPETAYRSDLSSFKLTAWTVSPEEIPVLRWLAVPEPGLEAPPALLQYKVLIHIDMVLDLREAGEPWFFGSSLDSGQSGLPDDDGADLASGGPRPRRLRLTGQPRREVSNRAAIVNSDRSGGVVENSNRSGGVAGGLVVPEATVIPPSRMLGRVETEQRKEGETTCNTVVQSGASPVGPLVTAPVLPVASEQVGPVLELATIDEGEQGSQDGVAIGHPDAAKMPVVPREEPTHSVEGAPLVTMQGAAIHDSVVETQLEVTPGQLSLVECMQPVDGHTLAGPRPNGNHAVSACDLIHVPEPTEVHVGNVLPFERPTEDRANGTCMEIVVANVLASGLTTKEAEMYVKLKAFCSSIVKKLAPPILGEVQASTLRVEAEPFTPRRTTRAAKKSAVQAAPRATPAENVLLRMLGLIPEDLEVEDTAVQELKSLFDSPLREQHVCVIAALFSKELPGQLSGTC